MTIKHRAVCSDCDWTGEPKLMNGAARDADEHRDETGHAAKIERAGVTDGGRVQDGDEAGTRVLAWWTDRYNRPWQFVTEGDYYALRCYQQGEWQPHESWVSWDEHGDTGAYHAE